MRILVLGSSGTGKTVLAHKLAKHFNLPLIHLDYYFWRPGWVKPSAEEWRHQLEQLVQRDEWVMDGQVNNLELRAAAADMIILLILPRWLCLWRVLKRYITHKGTFREDCGPGCRETLRWEFFKYTWTFPRRIPRMLEILHNFNEGRHIEILRSRKEIKIFLDSLDKEPLQQDKKDSDAQLKNACSRIKEVI